MTRATRRLQYAGDHGASAVEYALVVVGMGVALIAITLSLGLAVRGEFAASAGAASGGTDAAALGAAPSTPDAAVPADTSGTSGGSGPTDAASATDPATPAPTSASATASATPSSATPSPTPTSASPSPSATGASPSASPTRPAGSIGVRRAESADPVDVGATNGSKNLTLTVTPSWAGTARWDSRTVVLTASSTVQPGTVITVDWSYTQGSRTVAGTLTYWVLAAS